MTAERYAVIAEDCQWPLYVTLTVPNYKDSETGWVRSTRRAFGKLRRLRWWKKCVTGGVASMEITNTGKGWHPHIHCLLDCRWLSVTVGAPPVGATKEAILARGRAAAEEVTEQWSLCTGRKVKSLQVRRVSTRFERGIDDALKETLKYATKAADLIECKGKVSRLIEELRKTRMVTSFGTFFGRPELKRKRPQGKPCEGCDAVKSFVPDDVIDAMLKTNDANARRLARRIART